MYVCIRMRVYASVCLCLCVCAAYKRNKQPTTQVIKEGAKALEKKKEGGNREYDFAAEAEKAAAAQAKK